MVKRWTTQSQHAFLDARVNNYLSAKEESAAKRQAFLNTCHDDFVAEWPADTMVFSPQVGCASDSPELRDQKLDSAMRAVGILILFTYDMFSIEPQRLKNWFINNTRDTHSKNGSKLNLMQPRPRRPRATNGYAHLYGKERGLEAKVTNAYEAYRASLPPGAPAKRPLTLRDDTLKALLQAEDQDVKDAVDAFRNRPAPSPWLEDLDPTATDDDKEDAKWAYYIK